MTQAKGKLREGDVPEGKKKLVNEISEKLKKSKTILIASTKGLPASQFQSIKRGLRGQAEIVVAKKTIIERAILDSGKGDLQALKESLQENFAVMFSEIEAFELAALLADKQSPTKAKAGDILLDDINVEQGPTELAPGPAISELGSVGLKVAVEGGKLSVKMAHRIAKKGDKVTENLASVMGKLKIFPMSVGFIPLAVYDSHDGKIYKDIKIDKKTTLHDLREGIGRALGFAVKLGYVARETVSYFIAKAVMEEKSLIVIIEKNSGGGK